MSEKNSMLGREWSDGGHRLKCGEEGGAGPNTTA
jgi:hypothetical protein